MAPTRTSDNLALLGVIRSVRNRWRVRVLLRGLAIVLGFGFLVFLASAYGMDYFRFTATSVTVFRVIAYTTLMLLAVKYLVLPQTTSVSDQRVALYLEEHEPSLDGTVLSAVEIGAHPGSDTSPALTRRLVETAVARCEAVENGRRVERSGIRRSSGMLAGVTATAAAVILFSPLFLSNGTPFLLGLGSRAGDSPYAIRVAPGSITVARGADQRITAGLVGFASDDIEIATRRGDDTDWERAVMIPDDEGAGHMILLFDLAEGTDYYVEASGVRSEVFRIDVVDVPYVERLDLEYDFPAYTGLEDELVEDGGDVAALRGTEVSVRVTPTVAVPAGRLIVDNRDTVDLALDEAGGLSAGFTVRDEGYYRVELQRFDGEFMVSSRDYAIFPLDDQPPIISFQTPGRDISVSAIEEVFTELEVEDDYGLRSVELVFAVNGGDEQVVNLHSGSRRRDVTATYTFFLEDIAMEPGDFVSYYGRAVDNNAVGGSQTVSTDIYFMSVIPFDQTFRQSQQTPGQGGQQPGMDAALSETQRQIVAATFNLKRDRDSYGAEEFRENLATVGLMQGRLREQVESLVERMTARGIDRADSLFEQIAVLLPLAADRMTEAEDRIAADELPAALAAEQEALQQLQRAEALYRDTQVAQGQGGGGGPSGAAAEDLADLFDLELDRARNQYESVERGQREEADQQIDAALERLRELARRQQQEVERQRRARSSNNRSGGGGQTQRSLAEQAEEAARQLERLSREQSMPELMETVQELRDAAEDMRRAAARNDEQGLGSGITALDRLQEAQRLLNQNQDDRLQRDLGDALDRTRRLEAQQDRIGPAAAELAENNGGTPDERSDLASRKEEMERELEGLETQLNQLERDARRDQPGIADRVGDARDYLDDSRLSEMVHLTRQVVERQPTRAGIYEDDIASRLERLREMLEDAVLEAQAEGGPGLEEALEQTRELTQDMRSLGERIEDRRQDGREDGQGGVESQDGQLQGRAAEGQDQQGQQGQQGDQNQQGQQGRQPGGQTNPGGAVPRAGSPDGRPGLLPQDIRQFRSEVRERRDEAEGVRELLRNEGIDTGPLDDIIDRMRRLDSRRAFSDLDEIARLQSEIVQGLMEFEFSLRRELQRGNPERLVLSGSDEVPDEYRDLVDEYYRSLSEGNDP